MSLFNRAIRPPPIVSDEAIERYLATLRQQIEPDPLFRRRLRSDVVNQFVAAREGIGRTSAPNLARREMGRVGRACLYASFTLGLSAVSVLAVSQEALPGEVLYPLKQRIEELRIEVVPRHLHDELAAYTLGERIEEMGRLADAGEWELAVAMAPAIDRAHRQLVMLGASGDAASDVRIQRHLLVLDGLIHRLPANAREAVETVIDGDPGRGQGDDRDPNPGNGNGATPATGNGSPPAASATPDRTDKPAASAKPDPVPAADPTMEPERIPKPDRTPGPERTPRPEPSPPRGSAEKSPPDARPSP